MLVSEKANLTRIIEVMLELQTETRGKLASAERNANYGAERKRAITSLYRERMLTLEYLIHRLEQQHHANKKKV